MIKKIFILLLLIVLSACSDVNASQNPIESSQEVIPAETGITALPSHETMPDETDTATAPVQDHKLNEPAAEDPATQKSPSITSAIDQNGDIDIYTYADKLSIGIDVGDSPEQVKAMLGEPTSVEVIWEGLFDADIYFYHYDFGILRFEPVYGPDSDYYLAAIRIYYSDEASVRGCTVGMDYREVLASFPNEGLGKDKYGSDVLYYVSYVSEEITFDENSDFIEDGSNFGTMGYNENGEPIGIKYLYEGNEGNICISRLIHFVLQDSIVTHINITSKYSEGVSWRFYN